MKIHNHYYLVASICFSLITLSHAGEPEPLQLPEQLSIRVKQVLEIKTAAMKLPSMRSEEGKLGKQVENLMSQIAELVDEEIAKRAQQTQEHDIRAKIILWAKDRKKRPAEYARFAKFYMNRPASRKDAEEYFYRPWINVEPDPYVSPMTPHRSVPRIWTPHPVDKEDVIEANRYIMEYCFFMPQNGESFDNDDSRYNMMQSLISLKMVSRSYMIFKVDSDIYFEITKDREVPLLGVQRRELSNRNGWFAMILNPCHSGYERLSKYYSRPFAKHCIESSLKYYWGVPRYDNGSTFNNHQEWIKLAKQEWKEVHQQDFAKFLLSLPTPKKLVDPDMTEPEITE